MRLRGQTIGALDLFHQDTHLMPTGELAIGQALADEAFTRLRAHARTTHQRLSELAREVIDGTLDTAEMLS